ncbi:MAG: hypothetical protein ABW003_22900 [Microvirga sp.]
MRTELIRSLAAPLFAIFTCCASWADDLPEGTASQHRTWVQKFQTEIDAESTGSIAAREGGGSQDDPAAACSPAGLLFSGTPLDRWRLDHCR